MAARLLSLSLSLSLSLPFLVGAMSSVNNTMTWDAQLRLQLDSIDTTVKPPGLGGQDFNGRCCALALKESLIFSNNSVTRTGSFINVDPQALLPQIPCNAVYNGSWEGVPEVWVPYSWCHRTCPGWDKSKSKEPTQWVVPLVGFIIPAVVFCLAVPRRHKLSVPDKLFDIEINKICQAPFIPVLAVLAGLLVTLDTTIWVAICFAFSGPMLLSGLYEAQLDGKLLSFVNQKINNNRLALDVRALILFVILVGNLDPLSDLDQGHGTSSAWEDVQGLVTTLAEPAPTDMGAPPARDPPTLLAIASTKIRLCAMLACQYSFGSVIGAPVVFYTGAFIYTMIDVYNKRGDNDNANALAFGMWWMIIPHISIVGGCLLAGNNPSTLEGIISRGDVVGLHHPTFNYFEAFGFTFRRDPDGDESGWLPSYALVYQSIYRPASMWNRGKSKRDWIKLLCEKYPTDGLKREVKMRKRDWIKVLGGVLFLILIPSFLALFTAYFAPRVGLSCRSGTVLMYTVFQVLLIFLWLWDLWQADATRKRPAVKGVRVWSILVGLCSLVAIFITVGGTMMQIIGVYRNCLCMLSMTEWVKKDANVLLSTNNRVHIEAATRTWLPLGGTATAFLGVVAYIGWWYQRHLRFQFKDLVHRLDEVRQEDRGRPAAPPNGAVVIGEGIP